MARFLVYGEMPTSFPMLPIYIFYSITYVVTEKITEMSGLCFLYVCEELKS